MVYTSRDHVKQILREQEEARQLAEAKVRAEREAINRRLYGEQTVDLSDTAYAKKQRLLKELQESKASMLNDVILGIFNECFNKIYSEDKQFDGLKRNLVANFIKNEGVETLLRNFKYNSDYLAEFAYLVEETYGQLKKSAECCDKKFAVDSSVKDDFIEKLSCANHNRVAARIQTRVSDAVEDFITSNTSDGEEIRELLQNVQNKVANLPKSEAAAIEENAKRKVNKILNKPMRSIFSEMVHRFSKAVYSNPNLDSYKLENGKCNMDLVVETCKVMYTFLEMVNTTKMAIVNENTIKEVLESIGKN